MYSLGEDTVLPGALAVTPTGACPVQQRSTSSSGEAGAVQINTTMDVRQESLSDILGKVDPERKLGEAN